MYQYVNHSAIDYAKWDECIDHAENGTVYSLSWYLNIVSPQWNAIIKKENDKYISVFPVTYFKKFGMMKFIKQPHFANQLGLIHRDKISEKDIDNVTEILSQHFSFITDYPLNIGNTHLIENKIQKKTQPENQIIFSKNVSYQLDLSCDYKTLYKRFKKDRQNNIKRSFKNHLKVFINNDIEKLIQIFSENTASKIYGGVKPYQYDLLRKIYFEATKKGLSEIYSVRNSENEIITSSLFFNYKNLIIKFFNASTQEGRDLNGDSFLMDYMLRKFCGQHKIFDFERASLDSINTYKESYGAYQVFYPSMHYDNLPSILRTIKKIRYKALSKAHISK